MCLILTRWSTWSLSLSVSRQLIYKIRIKLISVENRVEQAIWLFTLWAVVLVRAKTEDSAQEIDRDSDSLLLKYECKSIGNAVCWWDGGPDIGSVEGVGCLIEAACGTCKQHIKWSNISKSDTLKSKPMLDTNLGNIVFWSGAAVGILHGWF